MLFYPSSFSSFLSSSIIIKYNLCCHTADCFVAGCSRTVIWFDLCVSPYLIAPQVGMLYLYKLAVLHSSLLIFQSNLKFCELIFASLLCSFFYLIFLKRSEQKKTPPAKSLFRAFQLFMTDLCSKHPSNWFPFIIWVTIWTTSLNQYSAP